MGGRGKRDVRRRLTRRAGRGGRQREEGIQNGSGRREGGGEWEGGVLTKVMVVMVVVVG